MMRFILESQGNEFCRAVVNREYQMLILGVGTFLFVVSDDHASILPLLRYKASKLCLAHVKAKSLLRMLSVFDIASSHRAGLTSA